MAELSGRVALITGAANGQGAAEAELFVAAGATVVLTDIDAASGAALAERLGNRGAAVFHAHDVVDELAWAAIVADTVVRFGGLHILVNNAGTIVREGIVDSTLDGWNRVMAVNLTGPLLGMKHCAPAIRDSVARDGGTGSIINISSTAGMTAYDYAAYTASKWALRGLTKTAVLQFSDWNIRVNSIHPATIADTSFERGGGEGFAEAASMSIPLGRLGSPRECAQLVLFLASEEAGFISGAEIGIDGGYIAAGLAALRNQVRRQFTPD